MGNSEANFDSFWKQWEHVQPKHPVYMTHKGRTGQCIPIAIHCDEGTTLKKKINYDHPVPAGHGQGTRKRKATPEEPGLNMLGNTLVTRLCGP